MFIFLYAIWIFSFLILVCTNILVLKDIRELKILLEFISILYLFIAFYRFRNRNFEDVIKEELIYDFKKKKNELYTLDLFFLDLMYLSIESPFIAIISITFMLAMIKLKIIYLFFLKIIITCFWTIHYFSLINAYKHLNIGFEIKLELRSYNYYWLRKGKIFKLYFIKMPQLKGFLINYFFLSDGNKKITTKDLIRKILYYRILGIPLKLILISFKLIIFLKKIIKSVDWANKKKTRWFSIFLYNIRWKLSKEINKEYSFALFWSSNMKIKNSGLNNNINKVVCIMSYLQYKKNYAWNFWTFYRYGGSNMFEKPHCTLTPNMSYDKDLNTFALVKTHSDKLVDVDTKESIKPFMVETNMEKGGLKNQHTYMSILPERKIKEEECSNSFKLNNNISNFVLEDVAKKNNISKAELLFKKEDKFLYHEGDKPSIGDLDRKGNWNYASLKFINEDVEEAREQLDNIIKIELKGLDDKERSQARKLIINKIREMNKEEFLNSAYQGAKEMDDKIIFDEINDIKENFNIK
jgi:hypothetical protein